MFATTRAGGGCLRIEGMVDFLGVAVEERWSFLAPAACRARDSSIREGVDTFQDQRFHVVRHVWC